MDLCKLQVRAKKKLVYSQVIHLSSTKC